MRNSELQRRASSAFAKYRNETKHLKPTQRERLPWRDPVIKKHGPQDSRHRKTGP